MASRQIANGVALLLDNATLTVDWPWLLGAEPELYSREAIELCGRTGMAESIVASAEDPREMSWTPGEADYAILARYGTIGRLLEMCSEHGVERGVQAFLETRP